MRRRNLHKMDADTLRSIREEQLPICNLLTVKVSQSGQRLAWISRLTTILERRSGRSTERP